jgi:hypothetical protein
LEVRQRLELLLEKPAIPRPEGFRTLRALEVLEYIGTPEAPTILESLAKGAPEARLTEEARLSLDRLAKRPVASP